jgi:hypothetical protein
MIVVFAFVQASDIAADAGERYIAELECFAAADFDNAVCQARCVDYPDLHYCSDGYLVQE